MEFAAQVVRVRQSQDRNVGCGSLSLLAQSSGLARLVPSDQMRSDRGGYTRSASTEPRRAPRDTAVRLDANAVA